MSQQRGRYASYPLRTTLVVLALALCGCAGQQTTREACESEQFIIDQQFSGGQFRACQVISADRFRLDIEPEDRPPINQSPWYAFRVSPKSTTSQVTVELNYRDADARYWPKISRDGRNWQRLPDRAVEMPDEQTQILKLSAESPYLWVSAQELLTVDYFDAWYRELAASPRTQVKSLASTAEGRTVLYVETASEGNEFVVLLGRQHPPEVTGTVAMRPFVDTLLGDSTLAKAFRSRFRLLIFPLLNPDGVERGYWRHNTGGVDLNRDWGPFTQVETRAAIDVIDKVVASKQVLRAMLDFHSTKSNLFYTQLPADSRIQPDFATEWLALARARAPHFEFEHDARPVSDQANSKNYFFKRFAVPAITYELGDETDRQLIESATPEFARTFMETLLAR